MKLAIAPLSLLLVACTASQPPAAPSPEPAVATPAPAAPEAPTAKRAPGQESTDPLQVFRAFGTEPFWNVNVEDGALTFTTPENQAGVSLQGTRRAVDGGVEVTGEHAGKPFVLTVIAGSCSDGMSDNQYMLVSAFRFGDVDYTGCAEPAK